MENTGALILYWRNYRNLTQQQLSELSGISRPNLSAIEQGARDITVGTLRRIASALSVKAGALVDGEAKLSLDRYALDRIARMAAGQKAKGSTEEKRIAKVLGSLMKYKVQSSASGLKRNTTRIENEAALGIKMQLGSEIFDHLLKRVEKNIRLEYNSDE